MKGLSIFSFLFSILYMNGCEGEEKNNAVNNTNQDCAGTFLTLNDQDCLLMPNCVGYPVVLGLYDSNGIIRASERIFFDSFGVGVGLNICKREVPPLGGSNNENNYNNTVGYPYYCKKFSPNGLYLMTPYVDDIDLAEGWVPCEDLSVKGPICGNGVIEPGEQCDTGQLGTFESCVLHSAAYGGPQYTSGTVSCWDSIGPCIWNLGNCQ